MRAALAQSGLVPVDAQVLLAHVLGVNRAWLIAHAADPLDGVGAAAFMALAQRRRDGEPVAYLTGTREFWGLSLAVTPAVLIPRPETETLVELALARLPADRPIAVLDLGTGSGAMALAIAHERPQARVLATDVSPDALAVAERQRAAAGPRQRRVPALGLVRRRCRPGRSTPSSATRRTSPPAIRTWSTATCASSRRRRSRRAATASARCGSSSAARGSGSSREARSSVEHGHDQSEAVQALFAAAGFDGDQPSRATSRASHGSSRGRAP